MIQFDEFFKWVGSATNEHWSLSWSITLQGSVFKTLSDLKGWYNGTLVPSIWHPLEGPGIKVLLSCALQWANEHWMTIFPTKSRANLLAKSWRMSTNEPQFSTAILSLKGAITYPQKKEHHFVHSKGTLGPRQGDYVSLFPGAIKSGVINLRFFKHVWNHYLAPTACFKGVSQHSIVPKHPGPRQDPSLLLGTCLHYIQGATLRGISKIKEIRTNTDRLLVEHVWLLLVWC